jgi:hypothetical protein
MSEKINKQEFYKVNNFYKSIFKENTDSVLTYANVYDYSDLTQEYFVQKIQSSINNTYPMTPRQLFYHKLRLAYNRKRICSQEKISRITNSNLSSLYLKDCTFPRGLVRYAFAKKGKWYIWDIMVAMLGKCEPYLSYWYFS